MRNIVRPNILNVKPYAPGKPIEEAERELGLKDVVKLASNENCLGPSPQALNAIKKSLKNINRYPDAACFYLKERLAKHLGVGEDNLIIGNGSDEIIVLAMKTFVNPSDEVVIARPTFLIYEIASQVQGARIRNVALTKDFKYDLMEMKKAIGENTKIVFIANPDNPTGTYVTRKVLDDFFRGLPDSVIVFLDEAYFEFASYSFKDYPNGLDYLDPSTLRPFDKLRVEPQGQSRALRQAQGEYRACRGRASEPFDPAQGSSRVKSRDEARRGIDRPNVIVSRSFSKAYGLAGLRIGYGISNAKFINYMERTREPFNVNLLAQIAAIAALDDKSFLKKTLRHVEKEKQLLYAAFDKLNLEYVPSATNFILVNVKDDRKTIFGKLLKAGVIVREMKAWGLDSFIRVTVGTREENRKFIKALRAII